MGTARYMAPEQARGEPVDARADLFAFGVTAYEMLAGEHPFGGASTFETLHAILTAAFRAQTYHAHAPRLGMEHVIRTVGRRVLASGKMIGGLAILEDAHHRTARLDAVPADWMEGREEEHLALVKTWMPKLPCDVDVLIVDEMGKNISGTGMGAKVVNRGPCGEYNSWSGLPSVHRISSVACIGRAMGMRSALAWRM